MGKNVRAARNALTTLVLAILPSVLFVSYKTALKQEENYKRAMEENKKVVKIGGTSYNAIAFQDRLGIRNELYFNVSEIEDPNSKVICLDSNIVYDCPDGKIDAICTREIKSGSPLERISIDDFQRTYGIRCLCKPERRSFANSKRRIVSSPNFLPINHKRRRSSV